MKLINFFLALSVARKGNHADLCTLNVCTKCDTVLHMYKTGYVFNRCRSMINSKFCCGKFIIGDILGMSRPRFWPHYWIRFAMLHSLCSSNFESPRRLAIHFYESSNFFINLLVIFLRCFCVQKFISEGFEIQKVKTKKTKYKTKKIERDDPWILLLQENGKIQIAFSNASSVWHSRFCK